ncbi:MAG TPA: LEA type 2 family protein [Natrialbaceae archaeon]|nr:LEA type 2 family protein [Natrialbaceae archaeon]
MVSRDGLARRLGLAVAVLVVALVAVLVIGSVLVAAGVIDVGAPRVTSMNTSWGQVTDDATEIETRVSVENPNPVGVPGVLDVRYRASMNDVVLAEGHKSGVGFGSGRSTLAIDATMQNDRIPAWWVTHVNGGERSELAIAGTVSGPFGVSRTLNDTRTIETDLLSGFVSSDRRTISMNGRDLLVLSNQSARWGEATAERTPIQFSAGVENRHEYPVTLDGVRYVVTMNEVTVGEGVTSEGFRVAPNETKRIAFAVALSTPRMADWWASHVRNDGRTNLSVSMYGVVDRDGERKRVPVSLFDTGVRFETDLLGTGTTTATSIENSDPAGMTYERPSIERFDRRWGDVSDAITEIRSTLVLENPNTGAMADLLELSVGERVTINGVEVAADETDVGSLDPGTTEIGHAVEMDNDAVPQWWAEHVNNGERSTVVVDPSVTADVGFTTFDVAVDDRESTVETDVLSGLTAGDARPLTLDGQRVGTVHEVRAEWGTATTDRTPVELTVRIENTAPVAIIVSDLGYDVRMNDVVVGDGTTATEHRIPAGETREVTFTIHLDSQSMDEWWVTHVRNDERTLVEYDATASVSARGRSKRVQVISTTTTVETDFLGAAGGTPRALVGDVFRPTPAATPFSAE